MRRRLLALLVMLLIARPALAQKMYNRDGSIFRITSALTAGKCLVTDADGNNARFQTCPGGGGGAPVGAPYVTMVNDATLTAERVLTAGSGVSVVDFAGTAVVAFDYAKVLVGDASLGAGQCVFDSTDAGILCEGATANAFETLLKFPTDPAAD